jgi:hypothetical protein
MSLDRRRRLAGLMLAVGFACFSCTFPSVEYDASCAVPPSCENEIATCGKKATATQNMCSAKCPISCVDCDDEFSRALTSCLSQCESCSASDGCMDATASCKALLGVP